MKIAQIGSSGNFEYTLAAAKRGGCGLVGLCTDRHGKSTAPGVAERYGFTPKIYGDFTKMLDETDADIVTVNSAAERNADFAAEALRRGKHVFSEKPIASDFESLCHIMREYRTANSSKRLAATKAERVCFCGMLGMMDESVFMTARRLVSAGVIGDIRMINAQISCKSGKEKRLYPEGGIIPCVAIDAIDLIWRIFGLRFSEVFACQGRETGSDGGSLETNASCLFRGTGGETVSVSADYLLPESAPCDTSVILRAAGTGGIMEIRGKKLYITDADGEREAEHYEEKGDIFADFLSEIKTGMPGRISAMGSFYSAYLALAARESADTESAIPLDFDTFCLKI